MDITCTKCGVSNQSTARFCARCGQTLRPNVAPSQQEEGGLDLPWLQSVQDQAEKLPTDKLRDDQVDQAASIPSDLPPDHDRSSPAVPVEAQPQAPDTTNPDAASPTEAPEGPPDEPPPGWVVSILEPAAPQPSSDKQNYEPEELAHVMPWAHGTAPPEDAIAGENVPGLPPWLNNITVQETIQSANASAEATAAPDIEDLEIEGIEPFAPPTGYEDLPAQPQPEVKIKPIEQVPEWLRSITSSVPTDEAAATQSAVGTDSLPAFVPSTVGDPSEPLPVTRNISVRAPRAGAVEAITALLQPSAETRQVVTGMLPAAATTASESRKQSGPLGWLLPDGLIYLAILASLLAILIVRPPFGEITLPASADAQDFYSQIESAPPDKPALLMYDWDATRSGEMTALSESVTHHLMSRRIRFVTLSVSPQGPGFAQLVTRSVAQDTQANYGYEYGRDYRILGYLPGNEAALAALMNNFNNSLPRDYSNSQKLDGASLIQGSDLRGIEDFGLIIALSSDDGGLRGLIEQVGARTNVPIIAAVPQALIPLLRPYKNIPGAGLRAVIGGPLDAHQYAGRLQSAGRISGSTLSDASRPDRLNAQSVASILVGLIILAALVKLLTNRALKRQPQ